MKKQMLKILLVVCSVFLVIGSSGVIANSCKKPTPAKNVTITFYVVRHGKTMLNTTDRVQGWSDAVLTPAGEKVVKDAGKGLKNVQFGAAYSSDSGRAVQTANLILKESKKSSSLKLNTDQRFREFNFGSYEGDLNHNMWTDIAKSQGKTLDQWLSEGIVPKDFANSVAALDKTRIKDDGTNWPAEDYATITTRLTDGINDVAIKESKKGDHNVLLVSHGLSIGALLDTISPGFKLPDGGLKNASVSKIQYKNGKFTILSVNDMSYVENGAKIK
ncbi:phosphoglycerate mutase [Listeria weihenstephanensis FSL R9-0317]|uniref:Histidine phosphatase family protein n=1 Tax=Listeria weihenstephanensis TaxID=1006155 RepID=A0A1S7FQH0_9LIST|nr:histidine phosphatase family protein [Listeria weihenstephanensis]AQY49678.1 phosphoglycerate mutase [Listeria weihenstephanensis]EUJ39612.1 phosphoglycerate mutase [Listeria weihenstephanensis FSL R9-0317]MBC1499126.1 histidine phosphatase family protein [Listeria weihenstephanensis]